MEDPEISTAPVRLDWADTLRVVACILVILCHCVDGYVPGDGIFEMNTGAALFMSGVRACVPLFVLLSGALLLPMRGDAEDFLRRRFTRIAVPFAIWGVILALLPLPGAESAWAPGNILKEQVATGALPLSAYNILMLPLNFTDTNVHFWFLYIILGLYLFVPVISPWIRQATTTGLVAFLSIWAFTLCLPYLQNWPGHPAFPRLHGQCDWNTHGMTHYFGGYLGYFILGHALSSRPPKISAAKTSLAGAALFAAGWGLTHAGLTSTIAHRNSGKDLEFFIEFLSPNVAMMTVGVFLLCRSTPISPPLQRILGKLSGLSFGVFLIHYWVLTWVREWMLRDQLPHIAPSLAIPLMAAITILISTVIAAAISRLPGKKWLLG